MMNASSQPRLSGIALTALLLAVSTVSAGYGIVLPILPLMLQTIDGAGATAEVARHTGLLTGLHAFALFLFAPAWGWLSDQRGRSAILFVGLAGFGASLLLSSLQLSIGLLYVERFLTGAFAAGITPVASAVIADQDGSDEWRSRRMAWISMAAISGFLLGPMLSGLLATLPITSSATNAAPSDSYRLPFVTVAIVAFLTGVAVLLLVPSSISRTSLGGESKSKPTSQSNGHVVLTLRAISFLVAGGVAIFEVGLALRGNQELGMAPARIALMFATCSVVMFAVQAVVFSPMVKPVSTRRFIGPALGVMAVALLLLPRLTDFAALLIAVAVFAASAGILFPILTYWIALGAGPKKGAELGKQTAVVSLGQALGSVAGGSFFLPAGPIAPFALFSFLLIVAAIGCFRLPRYLVNE